jgi:hypothetical protein
LAGITHPKQINERKENSKEKKERKKETSTL